jgi:hypothetical protein
MEKLGHSSLDSLAEMAVKTASLTEWRSRFHTRGSLLQGFPAMGTARRIGCRDMGSILSQNCVPIGVTNLHRYQYQKYDKCFCNAYQPINLGLHDSIANQPYVTVENRRYFDAFNIDELMFRASRRRASHILRGH